MYTGTSIRFRIIVKVNLYDNEILDMIHNSWACYIWYVTDKTSIKFIAFELFMHAFIKTQKSKLSRGMAILLCRSWNSFHFKLIARTTYLIRWVRNASNDSNFSSFSKWIFEIKQIEFLMRYHNEYLFTWNVKE